LAEVSFALVDGLGRVRVRTTAYSAPVPPGTTVQVKLGPATVELWHQGRCVGSRGGAWPTWALRRSHQEVLDLEHYVDVLERKPGALAGSKPIEEWRQAGRWPTSYDQCWKALIARHGRQAGSTVMIESLPLGRRHSFARLRGAIEAALALGCTDAAAVRHLLVSEDLAHERPVELVELRQRAAPRPGWTSLAGHGVRALHG
jgi:hypothetical protein